MLDFVTSAIAFVVAISVLVAVHEFGHYWVARRLGFKVLRFSIGFGKPLLRWYGRDDDRVEYWLSAIPLGGYVKMLDEREGPVPEADQDRAFNRRPVWQRIAVLLAGPGFNFLFAIVAYWVLFVVGVPGTKPYIEAVMDGSIAAEAGVRADDVIDAVGGKPTPTWDEAVVAILDELLADGVIDLKLEDADGFVRDVSLDVRGKESALTEPEALFDGLGIVIGPRYPPIVDGVVPGSPADRAGLENGDRVLSFDGQQVLHWEDWAADIRARPGKQVMVEVERGSRKLELPLLVGSEEVNGKAEGRIGVSSPPPRAGLADRLRSERRYGIVEGLGAAADRTWSTTALTVRLLGRMVTGEVSLKNASGPLMIGVYAGDYAQAGILAFLGFLSLISISLGIMNLLPVPILDGGQIVQQLIEWVKGSPLSERSLVLGQQVGLALLVVLMSFVFYNDITRLFGS